VESCDSFLGFTTEFSSTDKEILLDQITKNYFRIFLQRPQPELTGSWAGSIDVLKKTIGDGIPVIMEYIFPIGLERVDFIVVGSGRALLIEMKGWKKYEELNEYIVKTDIGLQPPPCYQAENYLSKFINFHSASKDILFDSCVMMYHTTDGNDCQIFYSPNDLIAKMRPIAEEPGSLEDVQKITQGHFVFSRTLIDFIGKNRKMLLDSPSRALIGNGYGLSSDQSVAIGSVLLDLRNGRSVVYLIRGTMGSGKTLVALAMLFTAISEGFHALLGYRNNRLINTLRKSVDSRVRDLLQFYSTGFYGKGIGEPNFRVSLIRGGLDLVIYDEAQRMTRSVIDLSMRRSSISVYFFDEQQILLGDEEGTRENFIQIAKSQGKDVVEIELNGIYRVRDGRRYDMFLGSLLSGSPESSTFDYDFRCYKDIKLLLKDLEWSMNNGEKVALVASFTESDGRKNKVRVKDPYIEWLMDPKTEYPAYWIDQVDALKKCASVYGSQGFEADVVGVIWGRDLIWRNGWKINPGAITDDVGGRYSIKSLSVSNPKLAIDLIMNRYRILLTRGIKGTFVYFEDEETMKHVESVLPENLVASR
jgi:DUF2075 family protein